MREILFVCHGNICRSPVAEIIFNDEIKKSKLAGQYYATSYALSNEEIGNDIYPPMKVVLDKHGHHNAHHRATRITPEAANFAYMICYMDDENFWRLKSQIPEYMAKFQNICEFSEGIYEIEDPWYTRRFELVYNNIKQCVLDLIKHLETL